MNADEFAEIKARHRRFFVGVPGTSFCEGPDHMVDQLWPCETARLLSEVERLQEAPPPREWFVEVDSTCSLIAARYPSALPADIIRDLAAISASARRWAALGGEE